jgi:capsular polysaccharide biosynthesis protein
MRNEAAIRDAMREHGIDVIDPESAPHPEVRSWFADAELVIGPHGAGLADLVYCAPGTVVLELIPTGHPFPYWYAAAQAIGADHRYLACPSTTARGDDDTGPSPHDSWCDIELLRHVLDDIERDVAARRQ